MGASGAMSNGTIIARAGSASVAMVADAMQRPVIICCETLKFVDRVQLDSITYNELGNPDSLAIVDGHPELTNLQGWQNQPQLGEAHSSAGRQITNIALGQGRHCLGDRSHVLGDRCMPVLNCKDRGLIHAAAWGLPGFELRGVLTAGCSALVRRSSCVTACRKIAHTCGSFMP